MVGYDIADYFDGIEENEYVQVVGVEVIPTAIVDGRPVGYSRKLYTARYKEQTFTFTGAPVELAKFRGEIVVVDTDRSRYNIAIGNKFVDGSKGNAVFEKESSSVTMTHMSPHLMILTFRRRGGALYENGEKIIDAPAWTGYNTTPTPS